MSTEARLNALRARMEDLRFERRALGEISKSAFMPAPPMPQGPPPMDPSMMQGGMPAGAPPMDPSMMQGQPPMDPAMMQGGAPMDPSMMQGQPPMDPAMMQGGAPPMDPAAMQAAAQPPAVGPQEIDELVGALEDMATQMQQEQQANAQFRQQAEQAINDLTEQLADMDQRLAALSAAPQPGMM